MIYDTLIYKDMIDSRIYFLICFNFKMVYYSIYFRNDFPHKYEGNSLTTAWYCQEIKITQYTFICKQQERITYISQYISFFSSIKESKAELDFSGISDAAHKHGPSDLIFEMFTNIHFTSSFLSIVCSNTQASIDRPLLIFKHIYYELGEKEC